MRADIALLPPGIQARMGDAINEEMKPFSTGFIHDARGVWLRPQAVSQTATADGGARGSAASLRLVRCNREALGGGRWPPA